MNQVAQTTSRKGFPLRPAPWRDPGSALLRKSRTLGNLLKNGRYSAVLGKMAFNSSIPLLLLAGGAIWLLLLFLSPWRRLRIGHLYSTRIGEIMPQAEILLRLRAMGKLEPDGLYLLLAEPACNRQLMRMIKRKVVVLEFRGASLFFDYGLKPFFHGGRFALDMVNEQQLDRYGTSCVELKRCSPQLQFLPQEEAEGRKLLESMGIQRNASYVCFHARDRTYLDKAHSYRSRMQWAYHDFRDSDIDHCAKAVSYLVANGLHAVRMGHTVEKPFSLKNPHVADYALQCRSDFGDIYLPSRCKFFLGTANGLTFVPEFLNVPIAMVNMIPLTTVLPYTDLLFIPKKHWGEKEARWLSLREIMARGAHDGEDFKSFRDAGIRLVENTPEEILALAREKLARLDGTWTPSPQDADLQSRYWAIFQPAARVPDSLRIGADFLRDNQYLLL